MAWIKWQKNKDFCIILASGLLTIAISIVIAQFVAFPYNLIIIIALCIGNGFIVRHFGSRMIKDALKK